MSVKQPVHCFSLPSFSADGTFEKLGWAKITRRQYYLCRLFTSAALVLVFRNFVWDLATRKAREESKGMAFLLNAIPFHARPFGYPQKSSSEVGFGPLQRDYYTPPEESAAPRWSSDPTISSLG